MHTWTTQQSAVSGVVKKNNNISQSTSAAGGVRHAGVVYPSPNLASEVEIMGYFFSPAVYDWPFWGNLHQTYELHALSGCPA